MLISYRLLLVPSLLLITVILQCANPSDRNRQYRREDYLLRWPDNDNDCQNLRHELLVRESRSDVTFTNSGNCVVSTGIWFDPYTEVELNQASDLDVDHVIPLAYAHDHGGYAWSNKMKKAFAVDQDNLLLVDDYENSVKGSKGPSEYLPAKGFHCEYLSIWKRVAEKYNIELDEADWAVIIEAQLCCGSS